MSRVCFKIDFQKDMSRAPCTFSLYGSAFRAVQEAYRYCEADTKMGDALREARNKLIKTGECLVLSPTGKCCATVTSVEIL